MVNSLKKNTIEPNVKDIERFTFPYIYPRNEDEAQRYLNKIYHIYINEFTDGCANGAGYIIDIAQYDNVHPIYILITIYALLVADANIYVIYEGSYDDSKDEKSELNGFLDEFLNTYEKAEKVTVPEESKYSTDTVIENLLMSHKDIKHIVYFGDFCNFYPSKNILSNKNIQIHLPAAHYIIRDYSNENIPPHDKQVLDSFGDKCLRGFIDYDAYDTPDNNNTDYYGFDIDIIYSHLVLLNTFKDYMYHMDKIVTIIFTDKTKAELNFPEEFFEYFDVHFSKNYNDNIINYDFTQLFR